VTDSKVTTDAREGAPTMRMETAAIAMHFMFSLRGMWCLP
jgi:hypothetical protein